ncbi:MAG: cystathionine gamma-lyase [Gemmatimonadota bacterium]
MRFATRAMNAGLPPVGTPGAFLPGPTFAGTYVAPGDPATSTWTYGRFHNPTWAAWEAALAELEGGPAVAFSSGMAAITAVLHAVLSPGDVIVLPSDSYYTTRLVVDGWFAKAGVAVRLAPTRGDAQGAVLDGARLLWLETPSNPFLETCDITRLADLAHRAGALVAVDNTTATCALQQPLALGADFSVASDTKMLTGHGDLVLGHVAVADPALKDRLVTIRTQMGAIPGPMEVWLAHRSLGTLGLRVERQAENARRVVEFLRTRPGVTGLRYPGLGPVVSFELADRATAERFLRALRVVREATSFGGIHSTAERRARWGGDPVSDGFIRFSVGCEDPDDLIEDLAQALP